MLTLISRQVTRPRSIYVLVRTSKGSLKMGSFTNPNSILKLRQEICRLVFWKPVKNICILFSFAARLHIIYMSAIGRWGGGVNILSAEKGGIFSWDGLFVFLRLKKVEESVKLQTLWRCKYTSWAQLWSHNVLLR